MHVEKKRHIQNLKESTINHLKLYVTINHLGGGRGADFHERFFFGDPLSEFFEPTGANGTVGSYTSQILVMSTSYKGRWAHLSVKLYIFCFAPPPYD